MGEEPARRAGQSPGGGLKFAFYGRVSTGRVDWHAEDHEETMLALGLQSRREIARTRIRVRTAMATQTREHGRYLDGRPPYGYQLADAGPHPNKAHAVWGRRAHRLEPDPDTAPVVAWMFAQRLAGHSAARITRALNDAGILCPSAADPGRNPHRSGTAWTLRTVAAILANPRYTGRQVWNRQRTDFDLVDPANTGLGHRQVQRRNLPQGWVISRKPAHPALVSEADLIAAQEAGAPRGPAGPATRRYLLAGLLACGRCGRRLESAWSNGTLLGAHGRPPLPAAGRSAQLEHRRLQPMAVRQPRGGTAAHLNGPQPSAIRRASKDVPLRVRRLRSGRSRGTTAAAISATCQSPATPALVGLLDITDLCRALIDPDLSQRPTSGNALAT